MRILTAATLVLSVIFTHADKSFERSIEGKLVVVTGGAGDICSAIADKFLEHGASSAMLIDINEEKGEVVKNRLNEKYGPGKAVFISADVITDLKRVFEEEMPKYGHPDVLVNCAGIVNEYDARKTIETNVIATIEWSDMMYEMTRKDKGGKGSTVIIVSDVYQYIIDNYLPIYRSGSAATVGYAMTKGHELNYCDSFVRLYSILLGFTHTSQTEAQMEIDEKEASFKNYSKSWKWQTVEQLANAFIDLFPLAESGSAHTLDAGKHYKSPDRIIYHSAEYIDKVLQNTMAK